MAVLDVKITDLDSIETLKGTELFLVADPNLDAAGNPIPNNFYTSNSISSGALSASFKEVLIHEDLSVIGEWTISDLNQPQRFSYDTYKNILSNKNKLNDMLALTGDYEKSQYNNLSAIRGEDLVDSLNTKYCYVPNFDYLHRLVGYVYDELSGEIEKKHRYHPSYEGLVVFNKYTSISDLTAKYGPTTEWERVILSTQEYVSGITVKSSPIDIRLCNDYETVTTERAGDPNFYYIIPFNSNTVETHSNHVKLAQPLSGFRIDTKDIVSLNALTCSISAVANTKHTGFYKIEVIDSSTNRIIDRYPNGNGNYVWNAYPYNSSQSAAGSLNTRNILTSDPPSNNSFITKDNGGYSEANPTNKYYNRYVAAESAEGRDNFGSTTDKWAFTKINGSNNYATATFEFKFTDAFKVDNLKIRIVGRNGWSETGPNSDNPGYARHPFRARFYIKINKITGTKAKSNIFGESSGIYAWRRTDSNPPQ